jgi:hypothetical protein
MDDHWSFPFLSQVPRNSSLWYLRPPGWATTCFIMTSGLSIALVFLNPYRSYEKVRKRLFNRAIEIGLIAYFSNAILRILQIKLEGSLSYATVIDVLTFQHPWSISSILIPVFIVLLIAPFLIKLSYRISPRVLFFCGVCVAMSYAFIENHAPSAIKENFIFQICFSDSNPLSFFPLFKFSSLAIWCFTLGVLFQNGILRKESWKIIMPVCYIFLIGYNYFPTMKGQIPTPIVYANQFLISIGFSFIIDNLKNLKYLKKLLSLIGRSSLLIFILHRPIVQAQNIIFKDLFGSTILVSVMLTITIVACIVICWAKERYVYLSTNLKKIGF